MVNEQRLTTLVTHFCVKSFNELYVVAIKYEDKKQSGTITKNQERNCDCASKKLSLNHG